MRYTVSIWCPCEARAQRLRCNGATDGAGGEWLVLHPTISLHLHSSLLSLFLPFSLSPVLLRPSLCFICTISKTVESTRRVSSGGRMVRRRRNKNAGNRRDTSCRAHHFTACAGLRSCVQQDFARISCLSVLPIPSPTPCPPSSSVSSRISLSDALSSFPND